jgi:hypothetical protein
MPAVKLGRWDGTVSFFTQGGLTYVNLLEDIMPILEENNYTFDLQDEREAYNLTFDKVNTETFSHVAWPAGHNNAGEPISLRDHQVEVINNFLDKELLIEGAYIGLNNVQNEQLTVKNTSEGIVCKINTSLYKNTIWEQSFMPILENNQINRIINNKKVDLLINNTKYVSCSKLNKSGISQISIK